MTPVLTDGPHDGEDWRVALAPAFVGALLMEGVSANAIEAAMLRCRNARWGGSIAANRLGEVFAHYIADELAKSEIHAA